MRLVDLSMTVEECDSTPFAKEEAYFKSRPIVRWDTRQRRYRFLRRDFEASRTNRKIGGG